MKSKNKKIIIFALLLTFISCFIGTKVYAKTVTKDEIQGPAYVIGTHVFTRNVNEKTGYEGKLTTNLIMLASRTITNDDLDNMIIYYKTASGNWINGLNGKEVSVPDIFNIEYIDIQKQENEDVEKPRPPIIDLNDGPLSIDDETDMLSYQLNIYMDYISNSSDKIDGVSLSINVNGIFQNIDLEEFNIITILDSYNGNKLEVGKKYLEAITTFMANPKDSFSIIAKSYVKDKNDKRIYSDSVIISEKEILPSVEITNEYQNPDYIAKTSDYYTYKLSVEIPNSYMYKVKPERFAYVVEEQIDGSNRQVGIFKLDEDFNISIKNNTIRTFYAKIGYYDKNGNFCLFATPEENKKYFTIDVRSLTKPILNSDQEGIAFSDLKNNGEYLSINQDFYKKQKEDTLDYNMEGVEIYRIYYNNSVPYFELVNENLKTAHVFPKDGSAYYTARVYATNKLGKKVYSEFSDIETVIRTPEIQVSEVIDGKTNLTVINQNEYSKNFKFDLYTYDSSNNEVLLKSFVLNDEKISIDVLNDMKIFVRAYDKDYYSSGMSPKYVYSAKSNIIDIIKK